MIENNKVYMYHTAHCNVCKIIEKILNELNIEPEKIDISADDDALLFIQTITNETAMPILIIKNKKSGLLQTLSGLHNENEVKKFIKENL